MGNVCNGVCFLAGSLTSTPTPTLNLPLIIMQKQLLLCDINDAMTIDMRMHVIDVSLLALTKNSLISPSKIRKIQLLLFNFTSILGCKCKMWTWL